MRRAGNEQPSDLAAYCDRSRPGPTAGSWAYGPGLGCPDERTSGLLARYVWPPCPGRELLEIAEERRPCDRSLDQHAASVERVGLPTDQIEFRKPIQRSYIFWSGNITIHEKLDKVL